MMKKIITILLALSLTASCISQREIHFSSKNFELIKLSDGVYSCIHKFGGKAICNVGIVDNGKETLIFDSFLSPDVSKELIELVEKLELSPIKYVINSHGHNDHIRGNQSFAKNVDIIATKKTREKIEKEEPKSIIAEKEYAKKQYQYFHEEMNNFVGDTTSKEYLIMKMMKPYFEELSLSYKRIETRLPNVFVKNRKEIKGPNRNVILLEFDTSHSVSDLIMYLPKEKVLFSGDIVFNKFHPYLAEGNPIKLKQSLNELKKMDIEKIIPGHGNIGEKEVLSIMIKYIEDLENEVEKVISENGNFNDLKSKEMLIQYQDWWLSNFYLSNLEHIFKIKFNK